MSTLADTRAPRSAVARRLPRLSGGGVFTAGVLVLVGALVLIPTIAVLVMSLRQGLPGQARPLTLANYPQVFNDPFTLEVLGNTLAFAVCTLAVTLLFAVPLAWLCTRTAL